MSMKKECVHSPEFTGKTLQTGVLFCLCFLGLFIPVCFLLSVWFDILRMMWRKGGF
jgi:hypothetical protein